MNPSDRMRYRLELDHPELYARVLTGELGLHDAAVAAGIRQPPVSLRQAINAKCRDCIYDPQSGQGTWRQQVEACTVTTCPLWPVRPKSKGG